MAAAPAVAGVFRLTICIVKRIREFSITNFSFIQILASLRALSRVSAVRRGELRLSNVANRLKSRSPSVDGLRYVFGAMFAGNRIRTHGEVCRV